MERPTRDEISAGESENVDRDLLTKIVACTELEFHEDGCISYPKEIRDLMAQAHHHLKETEEW